TSFSSSRSTPDLDYAHLRARLHQEEQAIQALIEQTDHRPAQHSTARTNIADPPIHQFGIPPPHWRPAEVA
ncbi:unnamed protein product, partial [Penicillium egyptiacum]